MALPRFKFVNAKSIDQAVEILRKYDGRAIMISGGTDLLHGFKDNIYSEYPELVVNLNSTNEGKYIKEDGDTLCIGALTKLHDIEQNKMLKDQYSVLAQAAATIASPQIRNAGTIGGNICQEPRCWYYRNADNIFTCTRKGGDFCNAMAGHNEIHSIFGSIRVKPTPCKSDCPAGNNVPDYFSKIREGNYMEAAKILLETNPIPAITGRVCPHTCEGNCNRENYDESVSIKSVERYVGDFIFEHYRDLIPKRDLDTEKRVAIIGSGPAGISAAFYLRKMGHSVHVFEQMPEAGGMLRYGIPSYRLPKEVIDKQIKILEYMGVEFTFNTVIGKEMKLNELRNDYDAVFLATGAWKDVPLNVDGEEKAISAIKFLQDVALGKAPEIGDKVVVVGGGNTAVDAAITSRRLGAEQVSIVYRRTKEEMPCIEEDLEQALYENVMLKTNWAPNRILVSNGKVIGLEAIKCTTYYDETTGRRGTKLDSSVKEIFDADSIILAIGQKVDLSFIEPELGINGKAIEADPKTQETGTAGLYAGGDNVIGPATVVKALAAGQRAASAINQFLNGTELQGSVNDVCSSKTLSFNPLCLRPSKPAEMPRLSDSEKRLDKEDALGLSEEQVQYEVSRCYNCGCVAASPSDIAPALVALGAKIKTTKRVIDIEEFFAAEVLKSTVLDSDEIVTEVQLPKAKPDTKSVYLKFRQRKSIDFPLLSVAAVITGNKGKIEEACISLGAAAPVPIRAKEAEEYLKGKEINDDVASEAAEIALKKALPLGKNRYKVQVARALVKKAILACR